MLEIFQYSFFQNALLAVLVIGFSCGIIGTYIVTRRLVFISGGITHASFGGLGLGFYLGVNPTLSALAFAVLSTFGVEWISKKGNVREDSAIAAFWSLGMAIGIIFIFLSPGYTPGLTEFLFGNILTVSHLDLLLFGCYTLLLGLFFILFHRLIICVAFDRDFAYTQHLPVRFIEYTMMLFISICIVLTIRLIGVMLMMSLLTIPQNTAMLLSNRFKNIIWLSAFFSILGGVAGLYLSYLINVPTSACIVFVVILIFILIKTGYALFSKKDFVNSPTLNAK